MEKQVSGACLCGAVKFTAVLKSREVTVCHCTMCNRWSGGLSMFVLAEGAPTVENAGTIGIYRSSKWGERGFCTTCGSSLFWRLARGGNYSLAAGTLDDQSKLTLATEIFVEDKPGHYTFANETVKQTGEQAMGAYIAADTQD